MSIPIYADLDMNSVARILNLLDPTLAQHPATKAYVDSLIEGLAWKDSCRVATQSNINLSSPGSSIDSISLTSGDRVLVRNQSSAPANGIYIWNGAASAMTRAADASTAAELEQAATTVEEGTDAGTTWRQSSVNFTLDSGDVTWTAFGTATPAASETTAGKAELATQGETDAGTDDARIVTPLKLKTSPLASRGYAETFGDGAATSYVITHNLGTRDVLVQVVRVASPYETILCEVERTSTNTITLKFASAPTTNQFRVLIQKMGG